MQGGVPTPGRAQRAAGIMDTQDFQPDIDLIAGIPMVPRILEVLSGTTGMRIAAIARVTEGRWVACSVLDQAGFGLKPADELAIETTFCRDIRRTGQPVHFDDASVDPLYRGHPSPPMYGFRSYVSVPIVLAGGEFFGTLCGLDPAPRAVSTPAVLGMFRLFADMLGEQITVRRQLEESETRLRDERAVAALREQFIAVLGHDLRSPLASIDSCIHLIEEQADLDDDGLDLTRIAQQNVRRMAGLINDVLDLARSRLGGGIALQRTADAPVAAALRQVVEEVAVSHPGRRIDAAIEIDRPAPCDAARIGQLFANLLDNAMRHGDPATPVGVEASARGRELAISVANGGPPIDPAIRARLFEPFIRQDGDRPRGGLGLGLFIAAEIAHAHGGTLTVSSDAAETRFTFRLPLPD